MQGGYELRDMAQPDVPVVARIWHEGWHDGHAAVVPASLTVLRVLDSFAARSADQIAATRVGVKDGAVTGFCMVHDDELYQMYVAPEGRGTGLAQALMADAETRIAAAGHRRAWLACAMGNDRAAAFYRKCGWENAGTFPVDLDTSAGAYTLDVWRFEKAL
ncbi:MAG: GNAT family N-acetyltransferase [Pseudomonadota bacterium]